MNIKEIDKINTNKNDVYRDCFSEEEGKCPYAKFNEYGNPFCSIDKISNIEFFGCIPQEAINKKSIKNKNTNDYLAKVKAAKDSSFKGIKE